MNHNKWVAGMQVMVRMTLLMGCIGLIPMSYVQAAGASDPVSGLARLYVKQVQFVGNKVIPEAQLVGIAEPYQGRWITSEDLEKLRQELTRHYINKGYVNSGVLIPDQRMVDGVLRMQVVEGRLAYTEVVNPGRLRTEYVADRLATVTDPDQAFNIQALQQRLKLIKQDPRIDNIDATVRPGAQRRGAELQVKIAEATSHHVTMRYDNYGSAALHGERRGLDYNTLNLLGWGDTLDFNFSNTRGLNSKNLKYTWPLSSRDSKLSLYYAKSDSSVLEVPFSQLDIVSAKESYAFGLHHPLIRQLGRDVAVGLTLRRQRGATTLFGSPYSFTKDLSDHTTVSSVLAFAQSWIERREDSAFALSSEFRIGTSLFGATTHAADPDSRFHVWWAQGEWFQRLGLGSLLLRGSVQISDDELFSEQRFSLGGVSSIRGYREGAVSADQGAQLSLEWRASLAEILPFWETSLPELKAVQVVPFMDIGYAQNKGTTKLTANKLHSVGLGLRWSMGDLYHFRADYGHALETGPDQPTQTLQDNGVHISMSVKLSQ